jgi:hypothetical protein
MSDATTKSQFNVHMYFCLLKLDLSHEGKNIDWGCLEQGSEDSIWT